MPCHRRSFNISCLQIVLLDCAPHRELKLLSQRSSKNKVESRWGLALPNDVTPHNPVTSYRNAVVLGRDATTARTVCQLFLKCGRKLSVDKRELTAILQNPESATNRLLTMWRDVPLLLMLDVDWGRGPLVLIGTADGMMWPLLPPGSLLQLDQRVRTISDGTF